jgi:ribonuclease HII
VPGFSVERKAGGRVAGVDEVGRGPLAGPVVAAAVVFRKPPGRKLAGLIDDSKKLSAEAREVAFAAIRACGFAEIGIGAASVAEIERVNIFHASLLAMRRALSRLPALPDLALIDGKAAPVVGCPTRTVVGGDALCLSIAAASIVAKVTRDRAMARLSPRFPGYGWAQNVGYATPVHRAALAALGPTRHHRMLFGVVRQLSLVLEMPAED